MPKINGDWFHNRSSSNLSELLTVAQIIRESEKINYHGMVWSGGRKGNELLYQLAGSVHVKPSTLQTKIRAMIRYGFVKDDKYCPIQWSEMGKIWNDLYVSENREIARNVYQITLITSLATLAFTNETYTLNPSKGQLPLKYLLNNLDSKKAISFTELSNIIDGDSNRVGENCSYWKRDLINSGLFEESNGYLCYNNTYPQLFTEIKNFTPDETLTDADWIRIRQNPIINISPFKEPVKKILEELLENDSNIDSSNSTLQMVSDNLDLQIPQVDILSTDTKYSSSTKKVRNKVWSDRVKKRYNYKCVVPECDATGKIFVQGCHIKPDNLEDDELHHRAHVLNGLCMCHMCHKLFDNGYFSLTNDGRILVSSAIEELPNSNQHIINVIKNSSNKKIKDSIDGRQPLTQFIEYHRVHLYKKN